MIIIAEFEFLHRLFQPKPMTMTVISNLFISTRPMTSAGGQVTFQSTRPDWQVKSLWKTFPKSGKNKNSYYFGLYPLTVSCYLKLPRVIVISKSNPRYLIYYNYSLFMLLKEKSGRVKFYLGGEILMNTLDTQLNLL